MNTYMNGTDESPQIDPHKHSQLNFDESAEAIQLRKSCFFSTNGFEQLDIHMQKK